MRFHRIIRLIPAVIAAIAINLIGATPLIVAHAAGTAGGPSAHQRLAPLYPSTPLLTDNFSSGTMSPFVPNNGLTPGGTWSVGQTGLTATNYASTAPLQNQIATVPNVGQNLVLDTSFTINQVNPDSYYRIGLVGHASEPNTGASQWDLIFEDGGLRLNDQYVNFPAIIPFAVHAGQSYNMQMVISGDWVGGKVWAVGASKPTQWTITGQFQTSNLTAVGLAAAQSDVTFHTFSVYSGPPSLSTAPEQANAIFSGIAPVRYNVAVSPNASAERGMYYVNYVVTNLSGTTVLQGQVPVRVGSSPPRSIPVILPGLKYGYYNTTFSLTNQPAVIRYRRIFVGHGYGPRHPHFNPQSSTPPPGYDIGMNPYFSGEASSSAPIDNTTTSMAKVPWANPFSLDSAAPFGVNGPGNHNTPIGPAREAQLTQVDKLFKEQGIQWIRTQFMWNYVEPSPGNYTWDTSDGLVEASHAAHENLLGLVDYWGNYADPFMKNYNGTPAVSFQTAVADYDQYIQALVKRYMPGGTLARQLGWKNYGISAWEIWNEPSTPNFWLSQNPAQYAELVKSAAAAIKAIDPSATILMYNWHNNTELQVAGTHSFNGVSIHDYPGPVPPSTSEFYDGVENLRQFLGQHGIAQDQIWMTESGWSSHQVTDVQQAEYLVRAEVQSLAGSLNKFFMFKYQYPQAGYGELDAQLLPKPAYPALAATAYMLNNYSPAQGVNPIEMGSALRAFAFQNGNRALVVLWANTGSGTLTIPRGNVRAFDWMGNQIIAHSGSLTVPLNGKPVYLVGHTSPTALAKIVQAGIVRGIAPVVAQVHTLSGMPTNLPQIKVTITDQINTPQSGTLSLGLPTGWQGLGAKSSAAPSQTPTVSFSSLDPGASVTETFGLSRFESNPQNSYTVKATATLAGGQTVSASEPVTAYETVYGHPNLTGTFQDWTQIPPLHVDLPSQNVGLPDWSPALESATAYTMWNHHTFYFAAKVKDSVFNEPYTGFYQWEGDSVQLFWDPNNTKTTNYSAAAGDEDIGIAKTPQGNQAYEFNGPTSGLLSNVKLTIVPGKQAGDMWYEAAIPLSDFSTFTTQSGHEFGFNFLVNDNNGNGRLGWIWLAPGIGNAWDPADFPTFTLVRAEGLAAFRLNAESPQNQVQFTSSSQGALLTVNNSGLKTITVKLSSGTILTLKAESNAKSSVTPTGPNPTVDILPNGTTTINLAQYVSGGTGVTLSASTTAQNGASAVLAITNEVQS